MEAVELVEAVVVSTVVGTRRGQSPRLEICTRTEANQHIFNFALATEIFVPNESARARVATASRGSTHDPIQCAIEVL